MNNSVEREFQNVQTPFWDDDKYLKPVTYESWLTFGKPLISRFWHTVI